MRQLDQRERSGAAPVGRGAHHQQATDLGADSFPDTWIICGKDGHLCGMGSAQDMVRLAR